MNLQTLPKCEHHVHIEGTLSPKLLVELAKKHGIEVPTEEYLIERYKNFTGLQDFLDFYYIGMTVLKTEEDYYALMRDYLTQAHHDGVLHAEIFFDPQAHQDVSVMLRGFERAMDLSPVSSALIHCHLRHLPPQIKSYESSRIIGIGLDSAELPFPPALFKDVYAASTLRKTAHAGEEGPAGYIKSALDDLHVTRIDHGIRLIDDEALLQRVVKENVLLTVCPLSNVRLRAVKSISELPIRAFLDKGVKFSINSDDPAYFGGYILDNYLAVQEAFNLTADEWRTISRNSIEGSWCSDEKKAEMLKVLEAW